MTDNAASSSPRGEGRANNKEEVDMSELYEGCDEEGPIRSIALAEFHPVQGPIIRCQVPCDVELIPKDVFDSIAVYIIPKPELTERSITLNVHGIKVCGFPRVINDNKYKRNQFMFNVCFVCHPWSRTVQFEPALKKLSQHLMSLELENQFLSNESNTPQLENLLSEVYKQLTETNHVIMQTGHHMLNLKLTSCKTDPPVINDWDVPILCVDHSKAEGQWDLTTAQVLPHINGLNYIVQIAALAEVETNIVKSCITNLVYNKVVRVIDHIFQYNNQYMVTPEIRSFRENASFREDFMDFLFEDPITKEAKPRTAKFSEIFRIIGEFKHGTRVKDICIRFRPKQTLGIDMSRLVQYLVLKGILRRLHKYPYHTSAAQAHPGDQEGENPTFDDPIYLMFDGRHHLDEICCRYRRSPIEVSRMIDDDPDVFVIVK